MDNFKQYLQDNKSKMDVDAPRDAVLESIQQKTNAPKQTITIKMVVRYLAAACILTAIVIGFKWMNNGNKTNNPSQIAANTPTISTSTDTDSAHTINPDKIIKDTVIITQTTEQPIMANNDKKTKTILTKTIDPLIEKENQAINHIENGYAQMVNLQLNKIRNTPVFAEGPSYFNSFKTQLQQMDKDEADIKHFIKTNGLTDELLDQLINVSQQKVTLLKSLQTEINKMNNQVKENQSPVDSTKSFYLHI